MRLHYIAIYIHSPSSIYIHHIHIARDKRASMILPAVIDSYRALGSLIRPYNISAISARDQIPIRLLRSLSRRASFLISISSLFLYIHTYTSIEYSIPRRQTNLRKSIDAKAPLSPSLPIAIQSSSSSPTFLKSSLSRD